MMSAAVAKQNSASTYTKDVDTVCKCKRCNFGLRSRMRAHNMGGNVFDLYTFRDCGDTKC